MIIGVPKEIVPGDARVALTPESVKKLAGEKVEIVVQGGAGAASMHSDDAYREAGARVEASAESVYSGCDLVVKVREPREHPDAGKHEVELLGEGKALVSLLYPMTHLADVERLRDHKITAFALDLMPRITRAQSMDVLSSMSSIAGYRAVILAAHHLPKYFPMLMTAAGTVTAARVLVLGAGVAGLQAIATAKRLGAVVEAFDIRPVVREQVESLGGRFVELDLEASDAQDKGGYAREQAEDTQAKIRELLHDHVRKSDVVITTALIPGKPAPVLVTEAMVDAMRPGSVIVDLAAEMGGNCESSRADEVVDRSGVKIHGPTNLAGEMGYQGSQLFSRNLLAFLQHLINDAGDLVVDLEDEVTRGPLVTRDGEVLHEATKKQLQESSGAASSTGGDS